MGDFRPQDEGAVPHGVPLSDRAMEILNEARAISGPDGLVFRSSPGGSAFSDMTYNALLRRLGIPAVPHGFRSSFTDWAEEQLPEYSAAADKALAHKEKTKPAGPTRGVTCWISG